MPLVIGYIDHVWCMQSHLLINYSLFGTLTLSVVTHSEGLQ